MARNGTFNPAEGELTKADSGNRTACKFCRSTRVIRYGSEKGTQYYFCKDCRHKFSRRDTIPKMQRSIEDIACALHQYYEGMSLDSIRANLTGRRPVSISRASIHNWVQRFTDLVLPEIYKYRPQAGKTWIMEETVVPAGKRKRSLTPQGSKKGKARWVIFWDVMDADTGFLLASQVVSRRSNAKVQALLKKAAEWTGKLPEIVVTDKLSTLLKRLEPSRGKNEAAGGIPSYVIVSNANLLEQFHNALAARTEAMHSLRSREALQRFADGWLMHFNFFKCPAAGRQKTLGDLAGIKLPFRNWQEAIELPYKTGSRQTGKALS